MLDPCASLYPTLASWYGRISVASLLHSGAEKPEHSSGSIGSKLRILLALAAIVHGRRRRFHSRIASKQGEVRDAGRKMREGQVGQVVCDGT